MISQFDDPFSKTVFWLALPFLLFFVGCLYYFAVTSGGGIRAFLFVSVVCVPAICFGFVLYDAKRFWWARRGVALAIFLMYVNYVDTAIHSTTKLLSIDVLSAGAGFVLVGMPALVYFFRGTVTVDVTLLLLHHILYPLEKINIRMGRKQPPADSDREPVQEKKWPQR